MSSNLDLTRGVLKDRNANPSHDLKYPFIQFNHLLIKLELATLANAILGATRKRGLACLAKL